ncbi:MAG TPA: acyl carrier protein [Anaeromyxobacteraceae bacterium]|nr:acyl carrier protein [Anaeromyxobacteraceae bacterium]
MTYDEVKAQLTEVFRQVFDQPTLALEDATTAKDVEGWDSLTHINLIVAAEKAFRTRFTTREVQALANVGDFIRLIQKRCG